MHEQSVGHFLRDREDRPDLLRAVGVEPLYDPLATPDERIVRPLEQMTCETQ